VLEAHGDRRVDAYYWLREKQNPEVIGYLEAENAYTDGVMAGVADLQEMKTIGSTDQVSIVAQFDRSGAKRTTNRYLLRKGSALPEDLVTALGETNTGDPGVLRAFVA